jgi:glycosyltransferase involved in cell wall biosynthesis
VRQGVNFARLEASGATLHLLGPATSHDVRLPGRMLRTVVRLKPDILQCWLLQMEVLGAAAAAVTRTPWIFSERSSAGAYPPTLKNRLRVLVASGASAIVANSEGGAAYWRDRAPSVRRHVISNGIPLDDLARAPREAAADGGAADAPRVVFSGRLDAGKNAAGFIEAVRRTQAAPAMQAFIYGDGPLRAGIERAIAADRLEHRIRMMGFATNLWSVLKRASVLISPSRFEGCPNTVLEAMACGCPVIVSDIPSHRELLDDESALFVPVDDAGALARAIDRVLADPEAAATRAARARQRAEGFAMPLVAERYIQVYREILTSSRRPGRRAVAA